MPASVLFFPLILGLAACGPRVTNRNIDALNAQFETAEKSGRSLSMKEVEAILGQPTRQENFPIQMQTVKELPGVRYYYEENGNVVELHFIDNKLIRRVGHFGDKAVDGDHRTMPKITPTPPLADATPAPAP
jgi:hypothetical protein